MDKCCFVIFAANIFVQNKNKKCSLVFFCENGIGKKCKTFFKETTFTDILMKINKCLLTKNVFSATIVHL